MPKDPEKKPTKDKVTVGDAEAENKCDTNCDKVHKVIKAGQETIGRAQRQLKESEANAVIQQLALAKDTDPSVRAELAKSANLSVEAQLVLAKDTDPSIRAELAKNPNLCIDAQRQLIHDPLNGIRSDLAHITKDKKIQLALVKDESYDVRRLLTYNKNIDPIVMVQLANDENVNVRENVAIITDNSALQLKLAEDTNLGVRVDLARNPHLTEAAQLKLVRNFEPGITIHPDILNALANNELIYNDNNSELRNGLFKLGYEHEVY